MAENGRTFVESFVESFVQSFVQSFVALAPNRNRQRLATKMADKVKPGQFSATPRRM